VTVYAVHHGGEPVSLRILSGLNDRRTSSGVLSPSPDGVPDAVIKQGQQVLALDELTDYRAHGVVASLLRHIDGGLRQLGGHASHRGHRAFPRRLA